MRLLHYLGLILTKFLQFQIYSKRPIKVEHQSRKCPPSEHKYLHSLLTETGDCSLHMYRWWEGGGEVQQLSWNIWPSCSMYQSEEGGEGADWSCSVFLTCAPPPSPTHSVNHYLECQNMMWTKHQVSFCFCHHKVNTFLNFSSEINKIVWLHTYLL